MQALIDFDGWRKWKDFATANGLKDPKDKSTGPGGSRAFGKKATPMKPPASTLNSTAASTMTENKDLAAPSRTELSDEKVQEESEWSGKDGTLNSMPGGLDGAGGALRKEEGRSNTALKIDTGS